MNYFKSSEEYQEYIKKEIDIYIKGINKLENYQMVTHDQYERSIEYIHSLTPPKDYPCFLWVEKKQINHFLYKKDLLDMLLQMETDE